MRPSQADAPDHQTGPGSEDTSRSDELFEQVDRLATEFLDRLRRGERPTIADYAARHPDLAPAIREVFPALVMVERLKPDSDETVGLSDGFGPRSEDRPPDRLGDYRILREIARGGMGIVYEAVQESLGRRVALKLLAPWANISRGHLLRFHREARSAAQLHHTNIVPVFGVGEDHGKHFYTMQFIHGVGLHQVLDELHRQQGGYAPEASGHPPCSIADPSDETIAGDVGRTPQRDQDWRPDGPPEGTDSGPCLSLEHPWVSDSATLSVSSVIDSRSTYARSVARVGLQVAEALAHAHEQGTLHRDIKPANILLDAVGNAWVTDFGLAKGVDDEDLTQTGDLVGTIRYMAPERFRGACDPRSDVYSLGLTLYELLARRPAFVDSDRHALMRQVVQVDPPRLESLTNGLPRDLATIIHKAIEKEPADRYRSAAEMAADLRRFLDDRPILARRIGPIERMARWTRRNPGLSGLIATVAALLLVVAGVSTFAAFRLQESRAEIERRLWDAYLAQARASRRSGTEGQRFDALESLTNASKLRAFPNRRAELRDEAIACFALADLKRIDEQTLPGLATRTQQLAFSPDGSRLAIAGRDTLVRVIAPNNPDHEELILSGPNIAAVAVRFSPDGHRLAVKYEQGQEIILRVYDVRSGEVLLDEPNGVHAFALAFDPSGRRLAAGLADGRIRLHDLDRSYPPRDLPGLPVPFAVAFSPTDDRIAVARLEDKQSVLIVSPEGPRVIARWDIPYGVRSLSWSPDGARLAAGSGYRDLWLIHPDHPGESPRALTGHKGAIVTLDFAHQGHLLASASWDGTVRLWHPESGAELVSALSPDHWTVQFSPDDRYLSGGREGATCWRWQVADGDEARFRFDTFHPDAKTWTLDALPGNACLVSTGAYGLRVLDEELRPVAQVPSPDLASATVFPGGRSLLTGGERGLLRWPIERDQDGVRFGPPEPFGPRPDQKTGRIRIDTRGDRIAAVLEREYFEAIVFDAESPGDPVVIRDHPGLERIALSPDGRWLATGTWRGTGVKVWDATNGDPVAELNVEGSAEIAFSPDGRFLLSGSGVAYQCWEVPSWSPLWSISRREASNLPGKIAVSPDGSLAAVAWSRTLVQLVTPQTGEILATLEAPNPDHIAEMLLNQDASLLFVSDHGGCIRRWNLHAIRENLDRLGIGWPERQPINTPSPPWRGPGFSLSVGRGDAPGLP